MRRFLSFLIVLLFTVTSVSAQLMYSISGNGLDKPSYICGIYHISPEKYINGYCLPYGTFENVEQVCCEVGDYPVSGDRYVNQMMMPKGFSYKKVLDVVRYKKFNNIFVNWSGNSLSKRKLSRWFGRMKPIVLSEIILPMLEPVYLPEKELDFKHPLDTYFPKYVIPKYKEMHDLPIICLETADEHMELLLGRPFEEQLKSLIWWLDNRELANMQSESIFSAYRNQDLTSINDVLAESLLRYDDEFIKLFIDERNLNWMKKIPSIMEEKPTLFFVGVAHLTYGDCGILKLLENAGYDVTPVEDDYFYKDEDLPFIKYDDPRSSPTEIRTWVMENMKYPQIAEDNGIEGNVTIKVTIGEDGKICRFEVLQSPDKVLSDAVISVLQKYPKKFEPARFGFTGEKYKYFFVLPVSFKLQR